VKFLDKILKCLAIFSKAQKNFRIFSKISSKKYFVLDILEFIPEIPVSQISHWQIRLMAINDTMSRTNFAMNEMNSTICHCVI
jgi:hypothetical protein